MKPINFQSSKSKTITTYECSADINYRVNGVDEIETTTIEFKVEETYDENNGETTIEITFVSDIPDTSKTDINEEELKADLENLFFEAD